MINISAGLAIAFGVFLAIGEVIRNWGDWQWWPFWFVDFMAATLLVFGGQRAWRCGTLRWLAGAWGFVAAMFYMSFFSHVQSLRTGPEGHSGPIAEQSLTLIIGLMTAIAFIGFFMALLGARTRQAT